MTRRDISLTLALCASLTLHTLLLRAAADIYSRQMNKIWLPGVPRQELVASSALLVDLPDDPAHRLGDSTGKGDSISQSPGETPMQATKGPQNQPFLSLDPAGPGKVGDEPSESVLTPGQAAAPAVAPSPPPSEESTPFGVNPQPDFSPAAAPATTSPPQQQAAASPAPQPAADPAPQGDSESDSIAIAGSAEFHRGSTQVRLGRNHKLVRPRLSLAAQADLLTLPNPVVVLKLKIDKTGNVISATIFRSSGSNNIDEPIKVAAYKWWFEPAKDRDGKSVDDVILFAVGILN
jgi:TonB family protein